VNQLKIKIAAAFFAVYVIWGSTYLAIRIGIETIPPLTLGSIRFFIAGSIMLLVSHFAKEARLNKRELKIGIISGILMISANGFVCIVEETIPSGIVAVFIGTAPIWMLLVSWLFFSGARPSFLKFFGALVGLIGIAIIARDSASTSLTSSPWLGFGLLTISCLSWTFGSLIPRRLPKVESGLRFSGLQMMAGAFTIGTFCLIFEKPFSMDWSQVSSKSAWALAYLIAFGSLIAFTAYTWLSRNIQPHLVSTYALVNPIVAVFLGAALYDEVLSANLLIATIIVIAGLSFLVLPESFFKFGRSK
jgi:drug/metabolite transporter (DMT)-like permease